MKDVIIVGSGIAGCTLVWRWLSMGKSVHMIANTAAGSSTVAAGVYNPMVLKRFTPVWKAQEQLDAIMPFYRYVSEVLGFNPLHELPIYRRLHDAGEVKTWERKALRDDLNAFMQPVVSTREFNGIDSPSGYGVVNGTGWCDVDAFMQASMEHLKKTASFTKDTLDYEELKFSTDAVYYKDIVATQIIFADGYGMLHNPFYKHLPLQGNKGELLIIRIPDFQLHAIIKSSIFIMPFKEDLFWVGATYDRDDKTPGATQNALEFLTSRLEKILRVPYKIISHKVGMRPTTIDRRPFVGTNHELKRHFIFNGMGSRALLTAPWAAMQLYNAMYNEMPLDKELDVARFSTSDSL